MVREKVIGQKVFHLKGFWLKHIEEHCASGERNGIKARGCRKLVPGITGSRNKEGIKDFRNCFSRRHLVTIITGCVWPQKVERF